MQINLENLLSISETNQIFFERRSLSGYKWTCRYLEE